MDLFDNAKLGCLECSLKYNKIVEKERIFKFFFGLNKNLDDIRGRILKIKPLPSIREVFFFLRLVERKLERRLKPSSIKLK